MFYVVFVAEGHVTWWSEAHDLAEAENRREEIPYHSPELGTGYVLVKCVEHGWRPTACDGVCQDCYDAYMEFEFRQEADYYEPDTNSRA